MVARRVCKHLLYAYDLKLTRLASYYDIRGGRLIDENAKSFSRSMQNGIRVVDVNICIAHACHRMKPARYARFTG